MARDPAIRLMLAACALPAIGLALHAAASVLAPFAFALFAIALVWPVQAAVQRRLGAAVGLLAAMGVSLFVLFALAAAIAWAFGGVAQWVVANAAQLQAVYTDKLRWAEAQGFEEIASLGRNFDLRWLTRPARAITGQMQGLLSFLVVMAVFVILGLLEVETVGRQLLARGTPTARALFEAARTTAQKLRLYMGVRTAMSLVTGFLVFAFARIVGLDLAVEWGVIAFVVNYIPFLGSLIATVLPTAFAALQTGDWSFALLVFVALQGIQFVVGSIVEPRIAGKSLSLSPTMTLVAVFLGALVWGMAGAFIGVQVLIGIVAVCERFEGGRFAAALLSGREPVEAQKDPNRLPSATTTASASSAPTMSTMNKAP